MGKIEYTIQLDDGKFWVDYNNGNSQELANFKVIDNIANGFKWGMAVQGTGQRKRHHRSSVTGSIYAMLDCVKAELSNDSNATVWCLTPDIEIEFKA